MRWSTPHLLTCLLSPRPPIWCLSCRPWLWPFHADIEWHWISEAENSWLQVSFRWLSGLSYLLQSENHVSFVDLFSHPSFRNNILVCCTTHYTLALILHCWQECADSHLTKGEFPGQPEMSLVWFSLILLFICLCPSRNCIPVGSLSLSSRLLLYCFMPHPFVSDALSGMPLSPFLCAFSPVQKRALCLWLFLNFADRTDFACFGCLSLDPTCSMNEICFTVFICFHVSASSSMQRRMCFLFPAFPRVITGIWKIYLWLFPLYRVGGWAIACFVMLLCVCSSLI